MVMEPLPSLQYERYPGRMSDEGAQDFARKELAELALKYVQLEEALGRPPEMKELGDKFTYRSKVLAVDDDDAWRIYVQAIERAKVEVERVSTESSSTIQTEVHLASPVSISTLPNQRTASNPIPDPPSPNRTPQAAQTQQEQQQPESQEKKRTWLDRLLGRR